MAIQRFFNEDCSLLLQIQRGNQQALAHFYDRHAAGVYSMALHVLREPGLAEGIAADIFLEVWHDPKPFIETKGSLAIAMAILARNRATAKLINKPAQSVPIRAHAAISARSSSLSATLPPYRARY